ncbi:MAG: tetratricopeptide repeat protein [Myxococcota bacterium]
MKRVLCLSIALLGTACTKEKPAAPPAKAPSAAPLPPTGLAAWQPPTGVPAQLPLLNVKGLDAFGFPNQLPDKVALLALLRSRQYEPLTKFIEQMADEIDKDPRKELWMFVAMNAFYQAAPDLHPLLDEWVQRHPTSFAPWSARSHYLFAVAAEARGDKPSSDTKEAQFAAMQAFNEKAAADLAKALELRPGVVENIRWRTKVAMFKGDVDPRRILEDGRKVCKDCLTLYQGIMAMLRPQWGGSYEQMDALAEEALASSTNPAMKVLRGASHNERCDKALNKERFEEALAACDKSLEAGRWYQYLITRADLHAKMKEPEKGLPFLNEALEQWPQDAEALGMRAAFLRKMGRWEEARNDVLLGAYVKDNEGYVKWERWQVMREILKVAGEKYKAKDWKAAEDLYDQALRVQPDDPEPWFWRGMTFKQRDMVDAAFGDFQEAVKHTRKWLMAYKELSIALVKRDQAKDAVELWNGFIADNPQDAEAVYLRGGVYNRLGDLQHAKADAQRACEMKFDKACKVLAEQKLE